MACTRCWDLSPVTRTERQGRQSQDPSRVIRGRYILISPSVLQVANARIQSLEATVENLLASESKLKQAALTLEAERSALLQTVEELRRQSAPPSTPEPDCTQLPPTGD